MGTAGASDEFRQPLADEFRIALADHVFVVQPPRAVLPYRFDDAWRLQRRETGIQSRASRSDSHCGVGNPACRIVRLAINL